MKKKLSMKHLCLVFLLAMNANFASAKKLQGVFLELGGASTLAGLHFDTRFNDHTHWGGRIGLAFTFSKSKHFFNSSPRQTRGWTFPVALNYLLGNERNHLEIGAGLSFGFYSCRFHDKNTYEVEQNLSGAFAFADIGYRYQTLSGLFVRAGVTPSIPVVTYNDIGDSFQGPRRATFVYPYLSVGFSF